MRQEQYLDKEAEYCQIATRLGVERGGGRGCSIAARLFSSAPVIWAQCGTMAWKCGCQSALVIRVACSVSSRSDSPEREQDP